MSFWSNVGSGFNGFINGLDNIGMGAFYAITQQYGQAWDEVQQGAYDAANTVVMDITGEPLNPNEMPVSSPQSLAEYDAIQNLLNSLNASYDEAMRAGGGRSSNQPAESQDSSEQKWYEQTKYLMPLGIGLAVITTVTVIIIIKKED